MIQRSWSLEAASSAAQHACDAACQPLQCGRQHQRRHSIDMSWQPGLFLVRIGPIQCMHVYSLAAFGYSSSVKGMGSSRRRVS